MKRFKVWLAIGSAALLSACAVSPRNQTPARVYDFGLPSVQSPENRWTGMVLEVRSPSWFETLGIDYRLAYDDPLRLREYADSRWAVNPGVLLAQRLRQSMGFAAVAGNSEAECLLRVELLEFSQVFDSPESSRGVLQGELVLFDGKRRRLAERQFLVERRAVTPDARGGVGALVLSASGLADALSAWLSELRTKNGAGFCQRQFGVK